jgi:phospholipid N-methyltransferase
MVIGLLALSALTGSALGAPRLAVVENSFDFGAIPSGQIVTHVFWLKSAGEDTLKILETKPGCGCTKAPLEKTALAPGDSTYLEVIFDSKKFSNRVTKSVRITTNESAQPQLVQFTAQIEDTVSGGLPLAIAPRVLDVSVDGKAVNQTMTLTNRTDQVLPLRLVEWPREYLTVNLPAALAPRQTVRAAIILTSVAVSGPFNKSFTFETGEKNGTRYTVPVVHEDGTLTHR